MEHEYITNGFLTPRVLDVEDIHFKCVYRLKLVFLVLGGKHTSLGEVGEVGEQRVGVTE